MPGTIQVSVLGLMDFPQTGSQSRKEENSRPLSLKVAMGKREYQSMGNGEFSFPVMSLRENLILMLHDADGNQMNQTEIRTISVVEKGTWDDFFPLKGGGCVHMKLQFSLSEDERLRIREMRESALKRKHGEQLKDGFKSSISDQSGNPLGAPLQASKECSECSFKGNDPQLTEVNKESLKNQLPVACTPERHISSEVGLDSQSGCSRSLVLGNVSENSNPNSVELEEGHIQSTKRKNLLERSSSNNVKKMISTFENSQSQRLEARVVPRTKSLIPKISVGGSLKRVSSEESDINKLIFLQTMSKSFSAEMLSEITSHQNPRLFQSTYLKKQGEVQPFGQTQQRESLGKDNLILNLKNDQKIVKIIKDYSSSMKSLPLSGSRSSAAMESARENIGTGKVVSSDGYAEYVSEKEGPAFIKVKRTPAILSTPRDLKAIEDKIHVVIPKGGYHLDAHIEPGTSSAVPPSYKDEDLDSSAGILPADEKYLTSEGRDDGNKNEEFTFPKETQLSREMLDESISVEQPCSLCMYQQGSSLNAVAKENESEGFRSHLDEKTVFGTSNETLDLLTYSDNEGCPFESLNIWIPRHMCITTGSTQLRDLVGYCKNCGGTHQIEKNSLEANEEKVMHSDASIQVDESEKNSFTSEKSNYENSSKLNGGLIEQGVRIAIIIVACGTLFFNTRPRKPRQGRS